MFLCSKIAKQCSTIKLNPVVLNSVGSSWTWHTLIGCQWFLLFSWKKNPSESESVILLLSLKLECFALFWLIRTDWSSNVFILIVTLFFVNWQSFWSLLTFITSVCVTGTWILQSPEKELHLLEECSWGTEASEQEMVRAGYPLPWRRCLSPGRGRCDAWLALTFLSVQLWCFRSPSLVSHYALISCS